MHRCLLAVFEMAMEMAMEMAILDLLPSISCLGVETDQRIEHDREGFGVSTATVPTPNKQCWLMRYRNVSDLAFVDEEKAQ